MKCVLLVDDNYDFLTILSYALKKEKINVVFSASVNDAIKKINSIQFDLICSDYEMGEKNGLDLLKHLRENNNKTKFIMLTGREDFYLQNEVEKRNAIFLKKSTSNLVNYILSVLSSLR